MDIIFKSTRLAKLCNDHKLATRKWGDRNARLLRRRLDEIRDADNLAILMTLPQARCHELHGNRQGQFSVDLEHPYRLLFEPANEPLPELEDGGLDLERITAVRILSKEDTHE